MTLKVVISGKPSLNCVLQFRSGKHPYRTKFRAKFEQQLKVIICAKPHNLLSILRESETRIISVFASVANPYYYI